MSFKQGYALVIGVGTHKYSPENNVPITVSDAESVNAILIDPKKCGYPVKQVTLLSGAKATKSGILGALDKLTGKVSEDATVLIFYAGHGAMGTDKEYYLVSHDARLEANGLVKPGTGVSQAELLAKLRAIKAKRALLIFNACHSGSLQPKSLAPGTSKKQLKTLSLPNPTAAALLGTGEGRIIITASRPDQLSYFDDKKYKLTYFTKALTAGLGGKAPSSKGFISAFSLYNYVYDAVTETTTDQEPMITVLQGVGPFAVALHSGKAGALGLPAADTLPEGKGVRVVTKRESQKWLTKIENQTIVKGDYINDNTVGRDQTIVRGNYTKGDEVGRDKIKKQTVVQGDYIKKGDKVGRDKIGKQINTGGGAHVGGNVIVGGGGSFAGRDHIVHAAAGGRERASDQRSAAAQRLEKALNDKSFTQADLADLCISLGIDWDSLDGHTKADKVRALVAECEQADKIDQLRGVIRLARPKLKDQL